VRQLKNIDTELSIREQKLIFEESWTDVFGRYTLYFLFGVMIYYPVVTLYYNDLSNANDRFMAFAIFPIVILLAAYVIYCKATEKNLRMMTTALSQEENRAVLLSFARNQGLQVYCNTKSLLILNQSFDSFNPSYKQTTVVVMQDNQIGFTIIRDQMKLDLPVLTSRFFLAKDLRRLFQAAQGMK